MSCVLQCRVIFSIYESHYSMSKHFYFMVTLLSLQHYYSKYYAYKKNPNLFSERVVKLNFGIGRVIRDHQCSIVKSKKKKIQCLVIKAYSKPTSETFAINMRFLPCWRASCY